VLRSTTNCFYTTPRGTLYLEASLPPISSICKHRQQSAALRLVCTPSQFNHATAQIPDSVPTWDQVCSADNHRFVLHESSNTIHHTLWNHPVINSTKHLPLDYMCHNISNLIAEVPILTLGSTDLVSLPLRREPLVTYEACRPSLE